MDFDREVLRENAAALARKGVFIGTSSWKYEGWLGQLYTPARYEFRGKVAKSRFERDCLSEYAETFKTVCVDAAYYTFPRREYLEALADAVPSDFRFGLKVTDAVTIKKFPNLPRFGVKAGQTNQDFLNADLFTTAFLKPCEAIRDKIGVLMFEFSKFWPPDYQNGRDFVADIDRFLAALPKGWPYAVEMRNEHWLRPEYFDCLSRHRIAHVFNSWLPVLIAMLNLMPAGSLTAQKFTIVHGFTPDADYTFPTAGLVISGDTLYGTTAGEGGSGNGALFAVTTDGAGFTNLHRFNGIDGASLSAGLLLSGNTLYGVASQGGSSSNGTVFAVSTDGTGFTNLYSFTGGGAEANPNGGLIISGNTLYGTAAAGSVFAVNTDGTGFTNLHTFAAGNYDSSGFYTNSDGVNSDAVLLLSGNTLFGTTSQGGSSGNGTVFAVSTNGAGFTNLYHFSASTTNSSGVNTNSDGSEPHAGLILSGNTLFGTASQGGSSGLGTVFSINTDGTDFTILYTFTGSDGSDPMAGLVLSGSTLYGTTAGGGSWDWGSMFAIHTDGTGFTNLHSFNWGDTGAAPLAGLILSGNTLYGTASDYFNDFFFGTVFSLSFPSQPSITSSGQNVLLTWPTNDAGFDYTGFTLQSTTNLTSSTVWTTNSPAPVVINGQNVLTVPKSGTRQFFRLNH